MTIGEFPFGFIGGSLVTLVIFFLTNRFTNQRLRTQLAHDRDLRNREREMTLRKEIYLAATEAAAAGLAAVSRFTTFDIPDQQLTQGYLEKAPSLMKVHVVANEDTVRAVTNFLVELTAVLLRLMVKRMPIVSQKQQIDLLRAQTEASLKDSARTLELQRQYNLEGLSDPHRWEVLQQMYQFDRDRSEQARHEADAIHADFVPKLLQFLGEVFKESIPLALLLTPVLVSIRHELDLPLHFEAEFRKISEEGIAKHAQNLEEFMRAMRNLNGGTPPPAA